MMEEEEIRQLIQRVLEGESREFAGLVREFGLPVRAFIHSRVHSRADAEDLAQETFIAAFRGLKKFRLDGSFEAWLIGIARHRVLAFFRSTSRHQATMTRFQEECLVRIDGELTRMEKDRKQEQLARLADCVDELPERMRKVVRAWLRKESGAQTAVSLNMSRGAVYMQQLRANRLLLGCMNQDRA